MPDAVDPYKVLQVDPEAETEVIQAAYRRLAQKYHPDVATSPEATARMAAINEAWKILGDPGRRASHDRARADASGPATPDSGGAERAAPASRTRADVADAPPETVSRDWTSGRSSFGGGYEASMHAPEGLGGAGPPPGNPSGSVLNFGRFAGWSLGEVARRDLDYIEWLDRMPIGRPYRDEIDAILRRTGRRRSATVESDERRGLFRRR
jgi:curved DNA-binding protein CbpA